jgi:hypothetical protein
MSQEVLVGLAKEVVADLWAQPRIEGMSDDELLALGLDDAEISSIRDGFFDKVLRLGISLSDDPGCCAP